MHYLVFGCCAPSIGCTVGDLAIMDPVLSGVLAALVGAIVRLLYQWITCRTVVRLTQLYQQGASERARCLPAGSRMTERLAGQETAIEVGAPSDGRQP
jgi:hypothetical protein